MNCSICKTNPVYLRTWYNMKLCSRCYDMLANRERIKQSDTKKIRGVEPK